MRNLSPAAILTLLLLLFGAGQGAAQLPHHPDTLRILAVGNSFSDDGTAYLPDLLEAAGVHNVILGRLYIGGCSLQRHCREYETGSHAYTYYKSGPQNRWIQYREASMLDGLKDEPWDIITMQEQSGISGRYENIQAWLPRLMAILRKECPNPDAVLVWHETWAYAVNADHPDFPVYGRDQMNMLAGIRNCVDRLVKEFGITTVIPSGEAVQLARESKLNNVGKVPEDTPVYDLTRDGYHLNRQYGRYIAACTWFQTLVTPVLGIPLARAKATLDGTEYRLSPCDARKCRRLARKACKNLHVQ